MISRALGPALGGSIGLMFTVANTISVATYTIGFSESLLDFLQVFIHLKYSLTLQVIFQMSMYMLISMFHSFLGRYSYLEWNRNSTRGMRSCWMPTK